MKGVLIIETRDWVKFIDIIPHVHSPFENEQVKEVELISANPDSNPLKLSSVAALDAYDGLCTSAVADFILWGNLVSKPEKRQLKRYRNFEIVGAGKLPSNQARFYRTIKVDDTDHLIAVEPPSGPGKERLKSVCKCGQLVPLSRVKKHECKFTYRDLLNLKSQNSDVADYDPFGEIPF